MAAIGQAVYRRYKRLLKEEIPLPQVLLIDGGRTQMQAAIDSLEKLEIDSILVLGISKGAARKAGMERIFVSTSNYYNLIHMIHRFICCKQYVMRRIVLA